MRRQWLSDMLVPISTVKANCFPRTVELDRPWACPTRQAVGLSYCGDASSGLARNCSHSLMPAPVLEETFSVGMPGRTR